MNRTFQILRNAVYMILILGYCVIVYYGITTYTDWNWTNWLNLQGLGAPDYILNYEPIVTAVFIAIILSIGVAAQLVRLFKWLSEKFNCLRWLA